MRLVLSIVLGVGLLIASSFTLGTRNIDDVKAAAPQVIDDWGFEIVGYEGYQHDIIRGGLVWYMIKRQHAESIETMLGLMRPQDEDVKTIYTASISKWGDEYHLVHMRALNAIKGN